MMAMPATHRSFRRQGLGFGLGLAAVVLIASGSARAEKTVVYPERFETHLWAQIQPVKHFDYSCATGWLAFKFRSDGRFIYDTNIVGYWTVSKIGDLDIHTNSGESIRLFYYGGDTMSKYFSPNATDANVFKRDYTVYKECPD
jgi:hypothetical protein